MKPFSEPPLNRDLFFATVEDAKRRNEPREIIVSLCEMAELDLPSLHATALCRGWEPGKHYPVARRQFPQWVDFCNDSTDHWNFRLEEGDDPRKQEKFLGGYGSSEVWINLGPGTLHIELKRGRRFITDDDDWDGIEERNWFLNQIEVADVRRMTLKTHEFIFPIDRYEALVRMDKFEKLYREKRK